jgi:hypothetical protein
LRELSARNTRLPETLNGLAASYQVIRFLTPHDLADAEWRFDWRGLAAALTIVWIWAIALLPMTFDFRRGWRHGTRCYSPAFSTGSAYGLPQSSSSDGAMGYYSDDAVGDCAQHHLGGSLVSNGPRWDSTLSSAAFSFGDKGGGLSWGVAVDWFLFLRGREAMGFGDVTLLAMNRRSLGWQAVLIALRGRSIRWPVDCGNAISHQRQQCLGVRAVPIAGSCFCRARLEPSLAHPLKKTFFRCRIVTR